jgi:hypothetical protein
MDISHERLAKALVTLVTEAYEAPADPRMTWFTDNEEGSGLLGSLDRLSAAEASRPLASGDRATAATHLDHARFALNLANRALRGESVHATADWKQSWKLEAVDEAAWKALREELRRETALFREAINEGLAWEDDMNLTGAIAMVAHGAWHLGALRQALGRVRMPER